MTHSTDRPLCASYVDATLHGSKYLDFSIKALKPNSRLSHSGLRSICYTSYGSDEGQSDEKLLSWPIRPPMRVVAQVVKSDVQCGKLIHASLCKTKVGSSEVKNGISPHPFKMKVFWKTCPASKTSSCQLDCCSQSERAGEKEDQPSPPCLDYSCPTLVPTEDLAIPDICHFFSTDSIFG